MSAPSWKGRRHRHRFGGENVDFKLYNYEEALEIDSAVA
jgi:hypothetical protein